MCSSDLPGCVFPDRSSATRDGGKHVASVTAGVEHHGVCGEALPTGSPSQRDADTDRGPRETGDPGSGHNSAVDPGQPGIPSHHWGVDDDRRECVEWDLLWVGPNDVGVVKTIVVTLQVASELRLLIWDFIVFLLF